MTINKYPIKALLPLVLLLGGCLVYLMWPLKTIEVRAGSQHGGLQPALVLYPESEVIIGFIQSIYKVKQEERYLIRGGKLHLSQVFFGSLDALNYYDPLESLPRKKVDGGYLVSLDVPISSQVRFAVAHSTPVWLRIDNGQPIPIKRFADNKDRFSLELVWRTRPIARLFGLNHG